MNATIQDKFTDRKAIYYILLFVVLESANMLFMESSFSILITIPQIGIVLYLLIKNDIEGALLWHLVFNLTACDLNTTDDDIEMLSYPAIKLIGPLTISYIILGLIWLKSLRIRVNIPKYTLFNRFRKVIWLFIGCGTIMGGVGLLSGFTISNFIPPFRYMLVAVLLIDIFSRLYNAQFLQRCYQLAICLLIASPIVSVLSFYFFELSYSYSVFESFLANALFVLAPCMILFLLYKTTRFVKISMLVSLVCFFMLTAVAARGSQFITLGVALIIIVYLVYFCRNKRDFVSISFFRFLLPICGVAFFFYGSFMLTNVGENLASNKFSQFISLFSIFGAGGGSIIQLDEIGTSPYIRVAEVLNVIDNGLHNPFYLILGQGYGGYYTDSLGLFDGIDLSAGAFNDDAIRVGKFSTAHSMYPNVLLFHGLIGFFLIVKLGILYLKNIHYTPLIYAAFVLLLYSLYYNVPLMNACVLFLFASERKIRYHL